MKFLKLKSKIMYKCFTGLFILTVILIFLSVIRSPIIRIMPFVYFIYGPATFYPAADMIEKRDKDFVKREYPEIFKQYVEWSVKKQNELSFIYFLETDYEKRINPKPIGLALAFEDPLRSMDIDGELKDTFINDERVKELITESILHAVYFFTWGFIWFCSGFCQFLV